MNENLENEIRLYGIAGSGKTTKLRELIVGLAKKHGSDKLLISSFSNTASQELVSRDLPVEPEQIATLHAHAYRKIGRPELLESKKGITEWNRWVSKFNPLFCLSGGAVINPDEYDGSEGFGSELDGDDFDDVNGDGLLSAYNVIRARMQDPEKMQLPANLKSFIGYWDEFKHDTDSIDFSDMIGRALSDTETALGEPSVFVFDEAQDFSAHEMALARHWGKSAETVIFGGDDDQAIFTFKGAEARNMLYPQLPSSQKMILDRSFRVPKMILDLASSVVCRVSEREPKAHIPREGDEGDIKRIRHSFMSSSGAIQIAELAGDIADSGKSVMVLATCKYHVQPVVKALRQLGIPFHNPYRPSAGNWNPLGKKISASKLKAYLHGSMRRSYDPDPANPLWTVEEFTNFASLVRVSDVFNRGSLKTIETDNLPDIKEADLRRLVKDEQIARAILKGDILWLNKNVKVAVSNQIQYLTNLLFRSNNDLKVLDETPKVVVGTIHSTKGGEADVVILSPDLSPKGAKAWEESSDGRDAIRRQFYVGITRAKETLVLAERSNSRYSYDELFYW